MRLNRKQLKKLLLKEMAGMMGGSPRRNLTWEKIADIHRFVEIAAFNGRHWMFPQGVDHDIYTTLNSLYVTRIARETSNDPGALQEYASMVMTIPGADLSSIEEILNA